MFSPCLPFGHLPGPWLIIGPGDIWTLITLAGNSLFSIIFILPDVTFSDEEAGNLFSSHPVRHPGEVIQAWLGLCGQGWIRTTECDIYRFNTL